jgi:predicted transcriptional regulator
MYISPCERMKLPSCPRTLIINILRKNPDGLTLTSIAQLTGLHRHTATKYVYELKGAGVISERDVGSAKLCYLREGFSRVEEKKVVGRLNGSNGWNSGMKVSRDTFHRKSSTGQVQLLTVFLFLFLIPATVIIAQNATQSLNATTGNLILVDNVTENVTFTGNVSESISVIINQTGVLDVRNQTLENVSVPTENLTANETILDVTLPAENVSANQTEANATDETVIIEPQNPVLAVRIVSPDRIIRGEEFDISAVVTNSGRGEARNVQLSWEIPSGFEVVSGGAEASCGTINLDSECTISLTLSSSIATEIGRGELKVKVRYEK